MLSALTAFLRNPYNNNIQTSFKQDLLLFFTYFIIFCFFVAISIILIATVLTITNLLGLVINSSATSSNLYDKFGGNTLIIVGILAPILEETVFRLPLSFKKGDLMVSSITLTGIISYKFSDKLNLFLIISIAVILSVLIIYILVKTNQMFLDKFRENYGKIIVYSSILIFALLHFTNFNDFQLELLPIYLILILPPFLIGLFATFYRLKLGFVYAILLHIIINTINCLFSAVFV